MSSGRPAAAWSFSPRFKILKISFSFSPPSLRRSRRRLSTAGVSMRTNPWRRYTARIWDMAQSRRATSSGSTSRMPRGGVGSSRGSLVRGGLLLRHGHDDLGLAGRLQQEVAEPHHRRDDRRLGRVLGLVGAEAGDAALEARVDGLQPEPGRPLEHDREQPFPDQVLGDDQLVDAVTVQIHRQRSGLDLEELAAIGPGRPDRVGQLDGYVPAAHRGGGAPELLALVHDLEPVELVDEGEG